MNSADSQPSRVKRIVQGPCGPLIFGAAIVLLVFGIAIVLLALEFRDFGQWSFDEVTRVADPQANVDAVLVETNGGATTSFAYAVFVVARGQAPKRSGHPVATFYSAVRSEHAYGVTYGGCRATRW